MPEQLLEPSTGFAKVLIHLQEKGASEVELADLWTKLVDDQEQQRIATIKFHEAEQKTIHTKEALQKSLGNASSAPSNPSPRKQYVP